MSRYYVWLLPCREHSDQLRRVMLDLNRAYGGPIFIPHVTLASAESPVDLRHRAVAALRLPVISVVAGHSATQCILVELGQTVALNQLQAHFGECRAPHLSLLYDPSNRLPTHRRNDLSSHVQLPFAHIEFDRIGLVRGGPVVTEWELLHTVHLSRA